MSDSMPPGFSMPLGASLYPPPPYEFRRADQAWIQYEVDTEAIKQMPPSAQDLIAPRSLLDAALKIKPTR